ncbi:VOC family protein [Streptomyces sp. NPDC047108]|uniref:VOC family protein n=1 Tax=Streptomyces sp. NPDC047108 TaxID=3155025 RepID=UPI0033F53960
MATTLQITIDCADPARLVRFWAEALGYEAESPPGGFASWREYWLDRGIPAEELGDESDDGPDSVVDPGGVGPRLWFQQVPESKVVKNRLHLDLKVSGGRTVPLETRRQRVDAEVDRLVAAGATRVKVLAVDGADYYAVLMRDPEENEFCVA